MEFGRPRFSEELVPGIRSESRDAREAALYATEIDRAENSRKIGAQRAHGCVALAVRLNTDNQEYRCAGEWRKNGLRKWGIGHILIFRDRRDSSVARRLQSRLPAHGITRVQVC